jgi:hypothetical protein
MSLLVVDPGKNALGWAYFGDAGLLYACGVVRAGEHEENIALVARLVIMELHRAIESFPPAKRLVTEQMVVYPGPQQKGDPNDLIALSFISGGGHMLCAPAATLELVTPHEWKGQVPKDIMQKRIERSLSLLEQQMVTASLQGVAPSLRHNAWDAVGIGLNALGRLR